jgi:type II restriction enzyme
MNLNFNLEIATKYHSSTQRARVLTEDWVGRNMYCPICGRPMIHHYENNRPVADFFCDCGSQFELKSKSSKDGSLGNKVADGEYQTMISRITALDNPNFFFLAYDEDSVNNVFMVPNHFFVPEIIEMRKPLAPTARRAGWQGCNILINEIPESGKLFVVKNSIELDHSKVIDDYQRLEGLRTTNLDSRGWILDVLSCVDHIVSNNLEKESSEFSLDQVYAYAQVLQLKHPQNSHVKDKIRQQLQYLRDRGFIQFTSRGRYKRI